MEKNRSVEMWSKVPQVTAFFWIIKVLCTTTGETFSDFLSVNLGLGLTRTSVAVGFLLAAALYFQFRAKRYIPGIYWLAVVLISAFGTLVTDNLTDAMGVPLEASTAVFAALLLLTFCAWWVSERTLSIHSIFTARREAFYWLAILFTFALGTASGDLMAEGMGLGYVTTGVIVFAVILCATIAWRWGLNSVLTFWVAYVMTRPLGASLGDWLSQPVADGGRGLGATTTSLIFLTAILAIVVFLSVTKEDVDPTVSDEVAGESQVEERRNVIAQTAAVVFILALAAGIGYCWRRTDVVDEARNALRSFSAATLSECTDIKEDALALLESGDLPAARSNASVP